MKCLLRKHLSLQQIGIFLLLSFISSLNANDKQSQPSAKVLFTPFKNISKDKKLLWLEGSLPAAIDNAMKKSFLYKKIETKNLKSISKLKDATTLNSLTALARSENADYIVYGFFKTLKQSNQIRIVSGIYSRNSRSILKKLDFSIETNSTMFNKIKLSSNQFVDSILTYVSSNKSVNSLVIKKESSNQPDGLVGSTFTIKYQPPNEPQRSYSITFLSQGRIKNNHPNDTTPDNDFYEIKGNIITMKFNNNYVTYTGKLEGNTIVGNARNITNASWAFSASRNLEGSSVTSTTSTLTTSQLNNSTWLLSYKSANDPKQEYTITLNPGGTIKTNHPNDKTPNNDFWSYANGVITLKFNNSYVTYTGKINGDKISGTAHNKANNSWGWQGFRR